MARFTILVLCLISAQSLAQSGASSFSNASEVYWSIPLSTSQKAQNVLTKSATVIAEPSSTANVSILNQSGIDSRAVLQIIGGSQNRLEVNQAGSVNMANTTLSGVNNSLVLNQTGGGNSANLSLSGTNNRFMVTQDGGDSVNMLGLQKDNTRLELSQGRGSNSFTLDNSSIFADPLSKGVPNLRIEQSGGSTITIQQGRVFGN